MTGHGTAPRRRIGLLGGSFDPIHEAHLALARCARAELDLDAVWLLPAGRPWQREPLGATSAQRWTMLELAIAGEAGLQGCDVELRRAGPTYTVDTLRELTAAHPDADFTFILGADQLARLPSWHAWRTVVTLADLAVAQRPDCAAGPSPEVAQALADGGHRLHRLAMPEIDVSATAVRERAAAGSALTGLVPEAVARYIESQHIYSPEPPHGHS